MQAPAHDFAPQAPRAGAAHIWAPPAPVVVPSTWLLVLQKNEIAPPLEHTTPRRIPTRVRFPWER